MLTIRLRHGDSFKVLSEMPKSSVAAIVSDPPYGLEFMGAEWDDLGLQAEKAGFTKGGSDRFAKSNLPSFTGGSPNFFCANCGGSQRGQDRKGFHRCRCDDPSFPDQRAHRIEQAHAIEQWHLEWLLLCHRLLKRGGLIKVFSATRTQHRLANAMTKAGFRIEQAEAWVYGSGFPKSLNVAKALDKAAGCHADVENAIQGYLKERRESLGLSKAAVDKVVFGGTTRYSWVEGRGGSRSDETYLPTPTEWSRLKEVLHLDDRYDEYIQTAIPEREYRSRSDGGKGVLIAEEKGDFGYQASADRWDGTRRITDLATDLAKKFKGYGTALKPAWEPFIVGRKP